MKRFFKRKFLIFALFALFQNVFASNVSREVVVDLVSREMFYNHYQKLSLDENFSKKFFDMYINAVNFRGILTKEDVDTLSKKYRNTCVQDFKNRTHKFFYESFEQILLRKEQILSFLDNFLSNPIDYTQKEMFTNRRFNLPQDALTEDAWKNYWMKTYHADIVSSMYLESEKKTLEKIEISLPNIEKDVRKKYWDEIKTNLAEIKTNKKIAESNLFSVYLNSFLQSHDPHCVYRDPVDSSSFHASIAGQIEGVGLMLEHTAEGPRVKEIIVGGPSWKQGEVKVNDIIVKVGQETGDLTDTSGKNLSDVVAIVRGKKGSKVRLVLKRVDGTFHTILIKRDVVVFESKACKTAFIKKENLSFGYIYLPSFYSASILEQNGRGCSTDVHKQLVALQKKNIQGLIFDVRGNPGGVLSEVIEILGFFLPRGPVLQVRTRGNEVTTIETNPKNYPPIFTGPLIVLVDEVSASASEILAAAIQDYQRGIILGTAKRTHGKGTVQRPLDLSSEAKRIYNYKEDIGSLVLTTQKFYRINGEATQIEGVQPDILLLKNQNGETGESKLKNALPWDKISAVPFQLWKNSPQAQLESIRKLFEKRVKNGESQMNLVESRQKERTKKLKQFDEFDDIPLSYEKQIAWNKKKQEYFKQLQETEEKFKSQLKHAKLSVEIIGGFEQSLRSPEKGKIQVTKWQDQILLDPELQESIQILQDLIKQNKAKTLYSKQHTAEKKFAA